MTCDDESKILISAESPERIGDGARGGFAVARREDYDSALDVGMLKDLIDFLVEWSVCVAEMFGEGDEVSSGCRSEY